MPQLYLRAATPADAPGIARVHVDAWRTTYRGIVPDEFLAKLSYEKRETMWSEIISQPDPRQHHLVAVDGNEVVGFSDGGVNRDKEYAYDGEVYAIYLRKEWQGTGLGGRLFRASMEHLVASGFTRMVVWVLADNPTCGFYERMGGTPIGEKVETFGGRPLKELIYGWDSLKAP